MRGLSRARSIRRARTIRGNTVSYIKSRNTLKSPFFAIVKIFSCHIVRLFRDTFSIATEYQGMVSHLMGRLG